MNRIISFIAITACAVMLMNSCQISTPEVKEGIPMTIQASIVAQSNMKTIFEFTPEKTLAGSWKANESITVVSFGDYGITGVDTFYSTGEAGRKKAEFSGTWTGNEGDKIICLYPGLDTYEGYSLYDYVDFGSQEITLRNLATALAPLQDNDTGSASAVDIMLGEVTIDGSGIHVNMEHQISVFRIVATLESLPYSVSYGEPYDMARVNTLRISAIDPSKGSDEQVFVGRSFLDVTKDTYTGNFRTDEHQSLDYYLLSSGYDSEFYMAWNVPVTKTFYVPIRFDKDLKKDYELRLQFGGIYYDEKADEMKRIDVFPAGDKRKTMTSTLPLENGKVYCIDVTI